MAQDAERRPLLQHHEGRSDPTKQPARVVVEEATESTAGASRTVEDNVLPEASHLGRRLGWQAAYMLVISSVMGSAIFAVPGTVLRSTGSVGLAMTIWIAGAAIAACQLAVTLEYGSMLPRSGGNKVYLEFTYPHPRFLASTLVAIAAIVLGFTASNCIVVAQYALFAFDVEASDFVRKALAAGVLTVVTAIHACTPRLGVSIQNALGWIKISLITFMIVTAPFVVVFRRGTAVSDLSPRLDGDYLWKDSHWSFGTIATSLFQVYYSYAGFDNINNVVNDLKDPVRTLKSVSVASLLTSLAFYTLINIAYFMVIPVDEIKASDELIAALYFERAFGVNVGRRLLPVAVALSGIGTVMVFTFALSRLNQEVARQGFLPFSRALASDKPFGAPMGGLIVQYIPSLLVIVLPPSADIYTFVLDVEGYARQYFMIALCVGLLWLRHKRPDLKRPFKAWPSAVVLMLAVSVALITAPFFPPQEPTGGIFYATYAFVGIGIIVFGVAYWFVWTRLIPRWRGYSLEEVSDTSSDGVTITRLVKVPRES